MTWLRTLAMPLQFTSLAFLVLVVALIVIALRNIPSNLVIAVVMITFALSWLNKYAFALLDAAANGRRDPPVASVEMLGPFDDMRVYVHPLLLLVGAWLAWRLGTPAGPIVLGALIVLLPASIAATAMSGRSRDAVNPVAIATTVRGLGVLYPLTLIGGGIVALLVWALVRGVVAAPVAVAIGGFAFFEWYVSLGALVFHRRFELDFTPIADPEGKAHRRELERQRQRQLALDECYAAVRAREAVRAASAVETWLSAATPSQRAVDLDYFIAQALAWPDQKGLPTLLRSAISYALRSRQPALAVSAAEEGLQRLPGFALEDAAEVEALALAARQAGRRRLAAQVIDSYVAARGERGVPETLTTLRGELPK